MAKDQVLNDILQSLPMLSWIFCFLDGRVFITNVNIIFSRFVLNQDPRIHLHLLKRYENYIVLFYSIYVFVCFMMYAGYCTVVLLRLFVFAGRSAGNE